MSDPALKPSSPQQPLTATDALGTALARQQQVEKRLNKISWIAAIVIALMISMMAANHTVYSLLATFVAGCVFLVLASVYERSLLLLLPLVLVFCLADNLLSHHGQLDYSHLTLQLLALGSFTALFRLSRPYLFKLMQKF